MSDKQLLELTADGGETVTRGVDATFEFGAADASELALYCEATLGGTTPTFDAKLQYQDPFGNWHDCASGGITQQTATFVSTASGAQAEDVTDGPDKAKRFRVLVETDDADGDETYTNVKVGVVINKA